MVTVAILGYGVVGSGAAELLRRNADKIAEAAKTAIRVKYILDLRTFPDSPYASCFVNDFSVIEQDPEVQVVVESIGGTKAAYDFTKRCLLAGKNVVTSNKELVAEHGDELLKIARENNLNYLFEASVGGGIPVLRPLSQCLTANNILDITGILNGTTNFILTSMRKNGTSFAEALAEARRLGYAEQDPTDDLEGRDACRKICILASLAFGRHIAPRLVSVEGISKITAEDIRYAEKNGYRIKLLGRAVRGTDNTVSVFVAPHMIPAEHPLAMVEDVYNGIMITGDAIGDVMFYGRGAGSLPTASAIVADVIDAAKHFHARKYVFWESGEQDKLVCTEPEEASYQWYTRPDGSYRMRIYQ